MKKDSLRRWLNYELVFVVSVLILSSETLWIRIFNLREGQNYTALLISLALLGFGVSGTVLYVFKEKIIPRLNKLFAFSVIIYLLSLPQIFFCYALIPFNALEILWDSRQAFYFLLQLLLLLVNFTFGSMALGLSFWLDQPASSTYFFNLLGSACGVVLALLLCYIFHPAQALWVLNGLGIGGIGLYLAGNRDLRKVFFVLPLLIINLFFFSGLILNLGLLSFSEYKAISGALRLPEAKIVFNKYTPEGIIQVVEAKGLRRVQGLSHNFMGEIPAQKIIYLDGNQEGVILPWKDKEATAYLDWCSAALPYALLNETFNNEPQNVLIMGISGEGLVRALQNSAEQIIILEKNYFLASALQHELQVATEGLFNHPKVRLVSVEPRAFLKTTPLSFDLIELAVPDSLVAPRLTSLTENYLYTCEAFYEMYAHLSPEGFLAITCPAISPYHEALKLWATVIAMLRHYQVPDYSARLAFIRSANTVTLCLSKETIRPDGLRAFCTEMSFEALYYPGFLTNEAKPSCEQQTNYLKLLVLKILLEDEPDLSVYPYDLAPATDDCPYFYNTFNLKTFNFWERVTQELPFSSWGAGIILLLLGPLSLLALLLIFVPLGARGWQMSPGRRKITLATIWYFGLIGMAYFGVELPLIQKLGLFLAHPLYSFTLVLVAMLIFNGVGSILGPRLRTGLKIFLSLGLPLVLLFLLGLDFILGSLYYLDYALRLFLTLVFLSLPALGMGFPLPQVLSIIKSHSPELVPMAWGVNGFASVISALAGQVLAMFGGFKIVFLGAVFLYTGASLLYVFYFSRVERITDSL